MYMIKDKRFYKYADSVFSLPCSLLTCTVVRMLVVGIIRQVLVTCTHFIAALSTYDLFKAITLDCVTGL